MALNITTYRMPDGILPKVEKQALKIIQTELERVDADGDFLATAKEQITIRANIKFKFVRYENGQLLCKIKPGDNSTAWTWVITPPSGLDGEQLGRRLSGEPDDQELLAAAIPPAPPSNDPSMLDARKVIRDEDDPHYRTDDELAESESAEPPPPAAAPGSIEERYEALRIAAQPYKERLDKIEASRTEVNQMMEAIEKKEAEIKKLEIASEKDAAGKEAFEKLHRIEQLLEL